MNSHSDTVKLPPNVPQQDYVPFGYIDNPYHTMVLNRSGIIRSVPPIGFGFWARRFPWAYGGGARREVNYLSFLHLSVNVDGLALHSSDDFKKRGVPLVSRYHTKNMMSYDWSFRGLAFSAKYILVGEHALMCLLETSNESDVDKTATVHASNIYGFPERRWWGCDGVAALQNSEADACVSKIWAYGDVFALGANRASAAFKATPDEDEWNRWMETNDISSNAGAHTQFPGCVYAVQSYQLAVPAGGRSAMLISLTRGVNEQQAVKTYKESLTTGTDALESKLRDDHAFYAGAPVLTGDWPDHWRQGWVYDYETLRMNVRPPIGIFRHPWDGMQIPSPRCVLGEALLDMMCLSYADRGLAKEVIYGTFADAPAPNIPCSREDGSMNMIGSDGSECGTSPVWGLPFHVIRSLYLRDGDDKWIARLYPHLKAFVEWWLEHRTDDEGWFFCRNSWESGQDGSKRFLINPDEEGDAVDYVRTVDVESAMANAVSNMVLFADVAGHAEDKQRWDKLQDELTERTREMYVDGWFRDWDGRTNKPIILHDYLDVMMFLPVSLGIATEEQVEGVTPKFNYFREHPKLWLEWPSFMFPFSEAAWNAGQRVFIAEVVADTGNRIYQRNSQSGLTPCPTCIPGMPRKYNYRIPGVANEYWPLDLDENTHPGCENYGWGATLPTLVIRNILGFRENNDPCAHQFILAPTIPSNLAQSGATIGISNLSFRGTTLDVSCHLKENGTIGVTLTCRLDKPGTVTVTDDAAAVVATADVSETATLSFEGPNGSVYKVTLA